MMYQKRLILAIFAIAIAALVSTASGDNIDPDEEESQYAYGENIGWVNFEPGIIGPNVGATVSDDKLTGFIWAENIGWISLSCENTSSCGTVNYGVTNDGSGNLSGYAWGENVGWINFGPSYGGVTIDIYGNFDGWAWGENIGWINFQSADLYGYNVKACKVNFIGLGNLVKDWLQTGPALRGDLSNNNTVDLVDYDIFAGYWRDYCPSNWPLRGQEPFPNLFFSEYVEGTSYNKAVEIYNAGGSAVDLSDCQIKAYHNGSATPTYTIQLNAVMLAPDDVFVVGHTSFSEPGLCDQQSGSLSFNGNDALELVHDGITKDVIGQIDFDPPAGYWGSGNTTTKDDTLRRKCTVTRGDPNGADSFDPSVEWDGFALDTFDGLGWHYQ